MKNSTPDSVFIFSSRLSSAGGAEKVAIDSAMLLADKDIKVFFSTASVENPEISEALESRGIDVTPISMSRSVRNLLRKGDNKNAAEKAVLQLTDLLNIKAAFSLYRQIKDRSPTVIHFHKIRSVSPLVFMAARLAAPKGAKIFYTCHDYEFFSFNAKRIGGACQGIYYYLFRKPFEYCLDKVVTPSNFVNDKISSYASKDKVKTVHNFFDKEIKQVEKIENKFCFIGRLEKIKGIDNLLRGISQVEASDFELYVIGTGSLQDELKEKYGSDTRIKFTGKLEHTEVIAHLESSSVSFIPSCWDEFFGLTALESIASGCFVVYSNQGALPEIFTETDRSSGYMLEADDFSRPEKIRRAVFESKKYKPAVDKLTKDLKKFEAQHAVDTMLEVYAQ
ncbi:glycosyltransferase [Marinobacterium aestuariivivens]|uniref:Glycosyltransferase n=1 Tax=Marinobacterium aestuariivivens TaxID=1698799 RepID=A0ABW1ZZM2_9GAMM